MKILFLTNYYPPCKYGWGYMQLCEEVADGLSAHGHQVAVLTSDQRHGDELPRLYPVHRRLQIDPDWYAGRSAAAQFFLGRRERERNGLAGLQEIVARFEPQVIFIWHAIGIPRVILQAAENAPRARAVYYLADYQPELKDEYIAYWQGAAVTSTARLLKKPLAGLALGMLRREGKPIALRYEHVICVSDFVRRRLTSQKLISPQAVVIHNGVEPAEFSSQDGKGPVFSMERLRCLVAGRIVAEKGVHTAINAFALLKKEDRLPPGLSLTILGSGPHDYMQGLQASVLASGLEQAICFRTPVPRAAMPAALAEHEALILPSEYDEPLARAIQEAMAMGLLVIGTTTGGSGELLVHHKTGLVFTAGDPASLAEQLLTACQHPMQASELARAGQLEVIHNYTIQNTVRQIEAYLQGLLIAA